MSPIGKFDIGSGNGIVGGLAVIQAQVSHEGFLSGEKPSDLINVLVIVDTEVGWKNSVMEAVVSVEYW